MIKTKAENLKPILDSLRKAIAKNVEEDRSIDDIFPGYFAVRTVYNKAREQEKPAERLYLSKTG